MNVGVLGGHSCTEDIYKKAVEVGELIAGEKWTLVCGGGPGVMEAVCKGAKQKGGTTVGILASSCGEEANPYLDVKLPTGLGYARNVLIVRSSDILVAIDGKYGTLSEIAFAFNEDKAVVGLSTWDIEDVKKVNTPQEVIEKIKKILG